ncbi:phosphatidate cytidylyltransferase [Candidatus Saccharibacteria bacterium]|nr:phosphatidate cytidylyltransferase [Candidatus Saccharibacteria bacterium]MBR0372584.1 phosphatidate cytidylyltransferase [Candidatus Saccharibacteria bacterium]
MDKNFKVRVAVGVAMFIVALIGLYTFDGLPFKIIFSLFSFISAIELLSFFRRKKDFKNIILAIVELGFLAYGTIFVSEIEIADFWYVILGVPGYDVFAYLFGKMLGGKIIKKSRPFPRISKNKTWEGTICGLVMSFTMVFILMISRGTFSSDWLYLLCGPLALIGDLFESFLKRKFNVKDSNEIVIKNKYFEKLEMIVGGAEGHGGFLDRVDSTAFTSTVLLILCSLL